MSAENVGDLLRRNRRESQERSKSRPMLGWIGLRVDVELSNEIPPAKQLPPEGWPTLNLDGEIDETQDTLVRQV